MKKKRASRQTSAKGSDGEPCFGHSETTELPKQLLSGFGCTKEEAFNDLCDKLLTFLETNRDFKCENGTCHDDKLECVTQVGEDPLERRVLYNLVRRRGCANNIGWQALLRGKPVRSNCVCAPKVV